MGDRATAVGVVSIVTKTDKGTLQMLFEEKTMILLDMTIDMSGEESGEDVFGKDTEIAVQCYYEKMYEIPEDLYTFRLTMSKDTSSTAGCEFGINRKLTEEEEKNADGTDEIEKTSGYNLDTS